MIKTTRWEQQYSIREPERYAWYSHWSIGHGQLSGTSAKRKNQYYKVISVFVCLYVCLKLNNYRTAGLIWLNFYLLAQSLSRDGFRPTKPDPGSDFSKNPEKPVWREILKYFCKNLWIFMLKIFEIIVLIVQ